MAGSDFQNFDLNIETHGSGYRVRADGKKHDLAWPFTEVELTDLRAAVEGPARDSRPVAQPGGAARPQEYKAKVKVFGERLFDAVFAGDINARFLESLTQATNARKGLRIRLHLDEVPELANVPWEYLYRRAIGQHLSISPSTPVVRYLEVENPPTTLLTPLPINILAMIADPEDLTRLKGDEELQNIADSFGSLVHDKLVTLDVLPFHEATVETLQAHLQQKEYHVFHFIGHGGFDEGEGVLYFEGHDKNKKRITAAQLSLALDRPGRPLQLVVLNSCEGAQTGVQEPFAGVAQGLVQAWIPATIAMQFRITDKAAISLAGSFYRALANNDPIDAALAEARKTLWLGGNPTEWGTPVLFMRSDDGRIFQIDHPSEEQKLRQQIKTLSDDAKAAIDNKEYSDAIAKLQEIQAALQKIKTLL